MGEEHNSDEQILKIANDLRASLLIINERQNPTRIVWLSSSARLPTTGAHSTGSTLSPDQCSFYGHDLLLSKVLKGKMEPEEWRPIIASQLIYQRNSRLNIVTRWFAMAILLLVGILGSFFLYADAPPQPVGGDYRLLVWLAFTGFIFIPFATWLFSHELRRVRLSADRRALHLVEPSAFIAVLRKIDGLQLSQIEKRKKGGLRMSIQSHVPSITERILAIEKSIPKKDSE